MNGARLAVFFVATLAGPHTLPLIPSDGAPIPDRVEIEWLDVDSTSLGVQILSAVSRTVVVDAPPARATSVRVVGPNVVSQPLSWSKHDTGLQLSPAGKLRLSDIPRGVTAARVFMRLDGSDLEYSRELQTKGEREIEFAVPLGKYSAAVDLGPERAPLIVPAVEIGGRSSVRLKAKETTGKPLTLHVNAKEDRTPLAGASISGKSTAELPPVFWRALAARCRVSKPSGELPCGIVPLSLRSIEVVAPKRRRARLSLPAHDPDRNPDQPLDVTLARYQNVAITTSFPRDLPAGVIRGLTANLTACERPPCDESKATRMELGPTRRVTFSKVEPGVYRTWLQGVLARSSARPVAVSDDSEAPDTVEINLSLDLWHIVGFTRLKDGVGIPAKIWFGTLQEGYQQELAGVIDTDSAGAYDLFMLAPAGVNVWAHAVSETPPGEGDTAPPGVKLVEGNEQILLDIELTTSGGVVRLVEKGTKTPVADCNVTVFYWTPTGGGARGLKSDVTGVVHWLGVSKGTFLARAACEGYRPASTEKTEISESSSETVLELEPAGASRVRVRDANGTPIPGARVFLEQSTFESVTWPFQIPADELGATDFNGEIEVPLRPRSGVYVVAPGHALYVAQLSPCSIKTGCTEDIGLSRPTAFPGITVRNSKGEPESAAWLVFSKDGVPIPVSIQSELVRANQGAGPTGQFIVQQGRDTVHLLPGLFGPGIYDVEYGRPRPGAPPERTLLGKLSLPTTRRVELTVQ